jgi:hypothetical protein
MKATIYPITTAAPTKPGVEVSWQITGIRHEAYADAYRIPGEGEKLSLAKARRKTLGSTPGLTRAGDLAG